jgi:acyl transferase domain-containing protein
MLLVEYKQDVVRQRQRQTDAQSTHVITTSARTPPAHLYTMRRLAGWLRTHPNARVQDIAYSTTAWKVHHPIRFALATFTTQKAIYKLEAEIERTGSSTTKSVPADVVFIFTGEGSHYAGMGAELYHTSSVFRKMVDLCIAVCAANDFLPFLDIITDSTVDVRASAQNTIQIQLAVVTPEIALTAFWRSTGIAPALAMGHSLGKYAALHAAGVSSLTNTLHLVGQRARLLLERCEPNSCAILSVSASVATVRNHLARFEDSSCDVACINSPSATVISGTVQDLERIQAATAAQNENVRTKMLSVPFAFYSV